MPSHVTQHLATFQRHGVELVFVCELAEAHHDRATLPPGWQKVGAGEFHLLLAPGWTVRDSGLRRVWPDVPADHKRDGWRVYLQVAPAAVVVVAAAGGSTSSSSRQQQAAAGSRGQQEAA